MRKFKDFYLEDEGMSSAPYASDSTENLASTFMSFASKKQTTLFKSGNKDADTTSIDNGHSHLYDIDDLGNGKTEEVNGHFHNIVDNKIIAKDGHNHKI